MIRQIVCLLSVTSFMGLTVCCSFAGTRDAGPASGTVGTLANAQGNRGTAGGIVGTVRDTGSSATFEQVKGWAEAYKAAHPGNGGKDWDINAKSPDEVAADRAAQQLLSICGRGQRPVIPLLAWEYGGADHRWVNPEASALVYCVYIPVKKPSPNWQYDAAKNRVVADVYVRFPDQNPCKDKKGKDHVAACIGDTSNFEILVDTASLNDGGDVGLKLSEASTVLKLILSDGAKVQLVADK